MREREREIGKSDSGRLGLRSWSIALGIRGTGQLIDNTASSFIPPPHRTAPHRTAATVSDHPWCSWGRHRLSMSAASSSHVASSTLVRPHPPPARFAILHLPLSHSPPPSAPVRAPAYSSDRGLPFSLLFFLLFVWHLGQKVTLCVSVFFSARSFGIRPPINGVAVRAFKSASLASEALQEKANQNYGSEQIQVVPTLLESAHLNFILFYF